VLRQNLTLSSRLTTALTQARYQQCRVGSPKRVKQETTMLIRIAGVGLRVAIAALALALLVFLIGAVSDSFSNESMAAPILNLSAFGLPALVLRLGTSVVALLMTACALVGGAVLLGMACSSFRDMDDDWML
jgi:hypothetical protein